MTAFAVFLFAYLLSQFFRSFLAVIAPELQTGIGMTATGLGVVSSAWFMAFAIAQFPVGWALDTYGPRRTVPLIMLAAVLGCVLFAAARDTTTATAAMALIGVGCAPIYMGALYVFGRTQPPQRFALLSSWMLGVGSAGNLMAATPLAVASETIGWRPTFFIAALLTLLGAGLIAAMIKDPPAATSRVKEQSAWADTRELVANRNLWPLLPIALVSYGIVAVERGLWMGPYLNDVYGLDPVARGNAALLMAIAMSLGALAYGPLDQWLGTRKWIVVAGTTATAAGFLCLALNPTLPLPVVQAILSGIGAAGLTYGVLMAHARGFFPEHLLGRGITMMNFLLIGGASLLQLASGRLVDALAADRMPPAEIYAVLHGTFAVLLLASCAIYLLSRDKP